MLGFLKTLPTKCLSGFPLCSSKAKQARTEQMIRTEKPSLFTEQMPKEDDKNIFTGKKSVHSELLILLMQFHRDQICPAARSGPAAKRNR